MVGFSLKFDKFTVQIKIKNVNLLPMNSKNQLYLEDLSVGQEFISAEHQVDTEQIISFASQFDPQPFHTDPNAAKDSFFKGHVASGWHTASMTMKLVVQSVPFANGIIGLGGEIAWPRPTMPGDILHVRSRITEIKPSKSKPDRALVHVVCFTYNQTGEVLQELTAKLFVFRRDSLSTAVL
jgi:acyl dehydratase